MTQFIQLHLLVSYPPANLNRDDLGRPKTAKMGGVDRLRVSSQSLKRAWRTSAKFQELVASGEEPLTPVAEATSSVFLAVPPARRNAVRTRVLSEALIHPRLLRAGCEEGASNEWTQLFAVALGESTLSREGSEEASEKSTLIYLSDFEVAAIIGLADALPAFLNGRQTGKGDVLQSLKKYFDAAKNSSGEKRKGAVKKLSETLFSEIHMTNETAADLAMFGRMVAINPAANVEAAVQVAHAISVHASAVEDDYFTAVDDLNKAGAGHVNEAGFAAAVFYEYLCIDRNQLLKNLGGDEALVQRTLRALTDTALTVGPSGKQNSFASRAYVHYALAEKGPQQPRSLVLAFLKPVDDKKAGYGEAATKALAELRANMDKVYGDCADATAEFDVLAGTGSKAALVDFVAGD